jgi:PKD repeat protein
VFGGWKDDSDCASCGTNTDCSVKVDKNIFCEAIFKEGAGNQNKPPEIISFTSDKTQGPAPLTVNFECKATDSDGSITAYEFLINDGQQPVTKSSQDGSLSYTFSQEGSYTVTCEAKDNAGDRALSSPIQIEVFSPGKVKLTLTPPSGGTVVNRDLSIECGRNGSKCQKELNPGDVIKLLAIAQNGYVFNSWGGDCAHCKDVLCEVVVNNDITCSVNFSANNNSNTPPRINSFTVDVAQGSAPFTVTFTCKAYDTDGSIKGYVYDVNGDSKHDIITDSGSVKYTYSKSGTYNARCGAIDDKGSYVLSNTITITVKPGTSGGGASGHLEVVV